MPELYLLATDVVLAIADEFFTAFGYGRPVLRGGGRDLLESGIHRAQVFAHYGEANLLLQAAALTTGIAQNQPFVDGNKRAAFAACVVFVRINGHPLVESAHDELADKIIALPTFPSRSAADADLEQWLAEHTD